MFECVFDDKTIDVKKISAEIDIPPISCAASVAPLAWAEHCVECAVPVCHATCMYFEPNRYGKCKRTEYGFKSIPYGQGLYRHATQMKLRKWGKLRCVNSDKSSTPRFVRRCYALYETIRGLAFAFGLPLNVVRSIPKDFFARSVRYLLFRWLGHRTNGQWKSDGLLLSVYSHENNDVALVIDAKDSTEKTVCRESVSLKKGMNNRFISDNRLRLNNANIHAIEMYAMGDAEPELTFFWFDKIVLDKTDDSVLACKDLFFSHRPAAKVKCVVWDLDNTLWDGIVGEDGPENIVLREEAAATVRELDRRGILCSIASKNDFQTAWDTVKRFGLDEYFLYPQISWNPKSAALTTIANTLNINIDTFAFIDDSPHERNEILALCPNVRVYEETAVKTILDEEPFNVPITEDSRKRRQYYQSEMLRRSASEKGDFSDYKMFIRNCEYAVKLFTPTTDDEWERCIELFQRTNQLNASGSRLLREDLFAVKSNPAQKFMALRCRDKYGEYGIVGCFILNLSDGVSITDFVVSCRVAGKKIESAVLRFLFDSYDKGHNGKIRMCYVPTERNGVLKTELLAIGGEWNIIDGFIQFSQDNLLDYDLVACY